MTTAMLIAVIAPHAADLVVTNAVVWSDGMTGFATGFAVHDGEYVYVGNEAHLYVTEETTVVDAKGKVVIPGIIDSHIHMLNGGSSLNQIQLRDAKDKQDFIARLKKWAQEHPEQQWITGGRWTVESWADKTEPDRHWLDEAVPDRPVYLSRMDGHSGVANTKALQLAGITKDTPDPAGGRIVREQDGSAHGILRETATGLVTRHIPGKSRQELANDLRAAMKHANSMGITAVSDIPGEGSLPVYQEVAAQGLTVRFGLYPTMSPSSINRVAHEFQEKEHWLELKGVKVYMDGTLGSRTAWMFEPFKNIPADVPNNTGLPRPEFTNGTVKTIASLCATNGLQLIGHAIGDRANSELVGVFRGAWPEVRAARPRLEHAQHLRASDIPLIGLLGVVTSYQPYHKADDGRYCESYIGAERSSSSYAYKDVLDSGGVLAFGSDWPVVTNDPFLGIQAAVTGRTLAGELWQTHNNIPVTEALRAYTSSAAYAMFWEKKVGRIAPGYLADFVVLTESPFALNPNWANIKPTATYVGGKKVFGD